MRGSLVAEEGRNRRGEVPRAGLRPGRVVVAECRGDVLGVWVVRA